MSKANHREIELKLRVPSPMSRSVDLDVAGNGGSRRVHLQAVYLDTPDGDLASHRLAWRLRKEGRSWVQTLKAATTGDHTGLHRFEHEVQRGSTSDAPAFDHTLHTDTPAGDLLAEVLAGADAPVEQRFHTDIWRRSRKVRTRNGTVELAFDRGKVASGERSMHVCELEIELVSGSVHAVFDTARKWVTSHGLWLDSINKAMRGRLVASGDAELPLVKASIPQLSPAMSADEAVRLMVRACLPQVMHNASAVSEGLGGHEHVHQARIGIRRIRTVLREFAEHVPSIDPSWNERLAVTFGQLGELRDREVVLAEWASVLAENGAPAFTVPVAHDTDPRDILRHRDFSLLLLDLLEFAHGTPDDTGTPSTGTPCTVAVASVLQRLHRQVRRRSKKFATGSVEYRHATRKTVKRLRYIAELSASLYQPRKVKRFLSTVAPAQERLGELNDLLVAAEIYQSLTDRHGQAWFAVGWLKARERAAVKRAIAPLQRVADAEPFWR